MKLSLILSLILLLSASLLVDASPLIYRRGECSEVIGDTEEPYDVPSKIKPPGEFKFYVYAKGIQSYMCNTTAGNWTFVGPEATLMNVIDGKPEDVIGKHYFQETAVNGGKATWEATTDCDSSLVIGKVAETLNAPNSNDIPWLLIDKTDTSREEAFSDIKNIVRIKTKKGVSPPNKDCGTKFDDKELVNIDYTTDYLFYT